MQTQIPSDCAKCGKLIVHDIVEPFANCGCGTSEWYENQFTPAMQMQKRMYEAMRIVETGTQNLLDSLQSKTHLVKYCKTFNLPVLWEPNPSNDIQQLRWHEPVITGLWYSVLTVEQIRNPFVAVAGQPPIQLGDLLETPTDVDSVYTKRILMIRMYSPSKYNYFLFVPVDLADYANKAKFDLEKLLERKLRDFDRKAILLVERNVRVVVNSTLYTYR